MNPRAILILTLAGALRAADAGAGSPPPGRITVEFLEPAGFTDLRDRAWLENEPALYLPRLREHLEAKAKRFVPAGCTLAITFTDIDLAGDFEPWRGPRWDDVRVIRDIYPPRLALACQVTDAEGKVGTQGRRELRDLAFLFKLPLAFPDDPLRHEKALLDDWLEQEFPRRRG
ncbi:MAG: DUF3016 domain-containing protein [Opitutaceae bacterium]